MGNRTLTNKDECLNSKLRFSCFSTFCEFFFFPFLIICCCCVSNFIIVSQSLHIHAVMISGSHKCRIFTKNVIIYYILCIKQNLSGLYKKKSRWTAFVPVGSSMLVIMSSLKEKRKMFLYILLHPFLVIWWLESTILRLGLEDVYYLSNPSQIQ